MTRYPDWPERLAEYLDERRDTPFDWATNNCAGFAAGAVEAMTGEPVPLPAVKTARGAARVLAGGGMLERVTETLGEPIPVAMAQRGDVGLLIADGRDTLAVCVGAHWAAPSDDGLLMVDLVAASAAWRV